MVVTLVAATLLIVLVHDVRRANFAADRLMRIHELETREASLFALLAQKDAQRESQRQVYVGRIRSVEAQLRDQAIEITALRAKSSVGSTIVSFPPGSRD